MADVLEDFLADENVFVLRELTEFAFAVLGARDAGELGKLNDLLAETAKRIERASLQKDTLINEQAMVARYPGLFATVRVLQNGRQRGTGPPYIKVGKRVFYRPRDVDNWIIEQEQLTNLIEGARFNEQN